MEITGPVDRKMIINALNSGAKVFMADFEDCTRLPSTSLPHPDPNPPRTHTTASTPTWENGITGQINL